jgi:indolepyruvate ferredoxin oxidoreductase beta subunit
MSDRAKEGRPVCILIAAMGGEGGGVLTDWIVSAAQAADLPVQGTSIPGVAQRTGATTYYIELWPQTHAALGGKRPVFGLGPSPGDVDVVVATELMEAGRCAELGYVSPGRTTLIAAARRVYSTAEKAAMADGRVDTERLMRAVREMPRHAVLFDPDRHPGLSVNALAFGVLAGCGVAPLPQEACRAAIAASGIAVKANQAAFDAGVALAAAPAAPPAAGPLPRRAALPDLLRHAAMELPPEVLAVADHALPRLTHYQSADYARLWLDRLRPIIAADPAPGGTRRIAAECGRQLALWMSYEDVIRVAQLKADPARFATIRAEVRAAPDQPVHVTDHMKPGLDEVASLLPPAPRP